MTREEAIEVLKNHHMWTGEPQEINDVRAENEALYMAIRSLEAWGEVIDYLDSRISDTKQDIEEDPNNKEWYLGYWQGLNELKTVIGTCMKEVEK